MAQGRLIYVMGPSGCGKDSLMDYARKRCPGGEAAFAHRYITRPAQAGGENHVFLHPDEFHARLERGLFALNWDSHGFRYGLGHEIDGWMEAGLNVVMNGSRAHLPRAAERYPDLLPVLVTVDADILRQRLVTRGRESADEIERRLERAREYAVDRPGVAEVDNSGELSQAGEALLALIRSRRGRLKKVV